MFKQGFKVQKKKKTLSSNTSLESQITTVVRQEVHAVYQLQSPN